MKAFLILLAIILISAAVYFVVITNDKGESETDSDSEESKTPELSAPNDRKETKNKTFEVSDESKNGLPSEKDFSDNLHFMTHQKVSATQKWGHLEITEERINSMLSTVEKSDYQYKELYTDTLKNWRNGDFSNAVEVHNTIWNEHNGTIGRATGLMTPEQEEAYKERYFE